MHHHTWLSLCFTDSSFTERTHTELSTAVAMAMLTALSSCAHENRLVSCSAMISTFIKSITCSPITDSYLVCETACRSGTILAGKVVTQCQRHRLLCKPQLELSMTHISPPLLFNLSTPQATAPLLRQQSLAYYGLKGQTSSQVIGIKLLDTESFTSNGSICF